MKGTPCTETLKNVWALQSAALHTMKCPLIQGHRGEPFICCPSKHSHTQAHTNTCMSGVLDGADCRATCTAEAEKKSPPRLRLLASFRGSERKASSALRFGRL